MPQQPNPFVRAFITTVVVVGGVLVAYSVFRSTKPPVAPTTPASSSTPAGPATGTDPAMPMAVDGTGQTVPSASAGQPSPTPASTPTPAQVVPVPPQQWTLSPVVHSDQQGEPPPIGSLDGAAFGRVEFSTGGAGVSSIRLSGHYDTIRKEHHVAAQSELPKAEGQHFSALVPFAAYTLEVTPPAPAGGSPASPILVNLFGNTAGPIWRVDPVRPGVFEATIVDQHNAPVIRVIRRYEITDGGKALMLRQSVDNLSPYPLTVRFSQLGPVEMPPGDVAYGGDKRRLHFGYLLPPTHDPSQKIVVADDQHFTHRDVIGDRTKDGTFVDRELWPNERSRAQSQSLVWASVTDRYFGVAVHPLCDPEAVGADKTLRWVRGVSRVVADGGPGREVLGLRMDSNPALLQSAGLNGASADFSLGVYAGPLDRDVIDATPLRRSLGIKEAIVINFGGPCGPCTRPSLTHGILWLLHLLHDKVFRDWSLAIIFLVVIVRSLLHPVTRWSQIKLARFGKQMQALGPKQKEIQEKYKGDQQKIQQETMRLWKEEGVSPTGMLGCVPMFLQMPIWIALSATLYFAVELRHQSAFYGLFQAIQPLTSPCWQFLGDLAEPDRLFYFGREFHIPLLSRLLGPVSSINILPILLGIVFFMQQKYIQQPTTSLTPEQELQMKMMKWMSVIMFPLFMYNAPAGLALYFTVNSTFAILESKWIRGHMDSKGLLDLDKMKAERAAGRARAAAKNGGKSEGSFLERLQKRIEEQQKSRQKDAFKRK